MADSLQAVYIVCSGFNFGTTKCVRPPVPVNENILEGHMAKQDFHQETRLQVISIFYFGVFRGDSMVKTLVLAEDTGSIPRTQKETHKHM